MTSATLRADGLSAPGDTSLSGAPRPTPGRVRRGAIWRSPAPRISRSRPYVEVPGATDSDPRSWRRRPKNLRITPSPRAHRSLQTTTGRLVSRRLQRGRSSLRCAQLGAEPQAHVGATAVDSWHTWSKNMAHRSSWLKASLSCGCWTGERVWSVTIRTKRAPPATHVEPEQQRETSVSVTYFRIADTLAIKKQYTLTRQQSDPQRPRPQFRRETCQMTTWPWTAGA